MVIYYFHSVIIFLLLILYLIAYSRTLVNEGFATEFFPSYCDCNQAGWEGEQSCMSCNNCGWCVDPNGNGSCVQGDNRGPYFADCIQYYYNGGFAVNPSAPYGPPVAPWYQKYFVPWYGNYNNNLISSRKWQPLGRPYRNKRRIRKRIYST